jgi:hypothetical protein
LKIKYIYGYSLVQPIYFLEAGACTLPSAEVVYEAACSAAVRGRCVAS